MDLQYNVRDSPDPLPRPNEICEMNLLHPDIAK